MQRVRIDIDPDCAPTRSRSTRSGWKRNSISPTYFRASCFASETINLERLRTRPPRGASTWARSDLSVAQRTLRLWWVRIAARKNDRSRWLFLKSEHSGAIMRSNAPAMRSRSTGRDRQDCIGNDAAFSMSFVQARTVAGGVPINGTGGQSL